VLATLWTHYDKDWVDVATFVTAGVNVLYHWWRSHSPMKLRGAARHMMDRSAGWVALARNSARLANGPTKASETTAPSVDLNAH
jgi:hypothetical protein